MDNFDGREPDDVSFLTEENRRAIAELADEDLAAIDRALLSQCDYQFRKVAFVVGSAMSCQGGRIQGIPDVFYAQRVRRLVEQGLLESAGNLAHMRYSEVRMPHRKPGSAAAD